MSDVECGRLYVFEGPDAVGKTTLALAATEKLAEEGVDCEHFSFPGRDAGTLGRLVYDVHHNSKKFGIESVDPVSLQMLHVAAHLDAISTRILPILRSGRSVVLDRFWWSTLVYGIVSGVGRDQLNDMLDVEHKGWGRMLPTVAFLISRRAPLRDEGHDGRWQRLRREYAFLARQQSKHHPVKTVENNASISEALDEILNAMSGAGTGRV